MPLPCETCPRYEDVNSSTEGAKRVLLAISEAGQRMDNFLLRYLDPEYSEPGLEAPTPELLDSMPVRIEKLEGISKSLADDLETADLIACGNLITCQKPEIVNAAAQIALDKLIGVVNAAPFE